MNVKLKTRLLDWLKLAACVALGIDLPILNLPNDMPWEMVEMFIR